MDKLVHSKYTPLLPSACSAAPLGLFAFGYTTALLQGANSAITGALLGRSRLLSAIDRS